MIHFTKNSGQYHPGVAYVGVAPADSYKGAGLVRLHRDGVKFHGIEYVKPTCTEDLLGWEFQGRTLPSTMVDEDEMAIMEVALWDQFDSEFSHAIVSGGEIVIEHGTAAAALLNLVGDHA
jgi:hypothetical protein